ncbi:MAG: hypothetical protein ACT4PT_09315 [Methanobacteriota archaeon]
MLGTASGRRLGLGAAVVALLLLPATGVFAAGTAAQVKDRAGDADRKYDLLSVTIGNESAEAFDVVFALQEIPRPSPGETAHVLLRFILDRDSDKDRLYVGARLTPDGNATFETGSLGRDANGDDLRDWTPLETGLAGVVSRPDATITVTVPKGALAAHLSEGDEIADPIGVAFVVPDGRQPGDAGTRPPATVKDIAPDDGAGTDFVFAIAYLPGDFLVATHPTVENNRLYLHASSQDPQQWMNALAADPDSTERLLLHEGDTLQGAFEYGFRALEPVGQCFEGTPFAFLLDPGLLSDLGLSAAAATFVLRAEVDTPEADPDAPGALRKDFVEARLVWGDIDEDTPFSPPGDGGDGNVSTARADGIEHGAAKDYTMAFSGIFQNLSEEDDLVLTVSYCPGGRVSGGGYRIHLDGASYLELPISTPSNADLLGLLTDSVDFGPGFGVDFEADFGDDFRFTDRSDDEENADGGRDVPIFGAFGILAAVAACAALFRRRGGAGRGLR